MGHYFKKYSATIETASAYCVKCDSYVELLNPPNFIIMRNIKKGLL